MSSVIRLGRPGEWDKVFALREEKHPQLSEPLYVLIYVDDGDGVPMTGAFLDPWVAWEYIKKHREELINKKFEEIFTSKQ